MERTNEDSVLDVTPPKKEKKGGILSAITNALKKARETRHSGKETAFYDAAVFVISLLFARCHVVFGAYPLAISVIAVLPSRVWLAALGSLAGALTLGMPGVIYAIISIIVAFLRVIISATDKRGGDGEEELFHEGMILKLSSALIGGFIAAVYEVLLNSFTTESLLFGISMVLLPPVIAYALSGLFEASISPRAIFFEAGEVFKEKTSDKRDSLLFFRLSAILGIFLISLSLKQYELFGISAGFVFSALATLFAARRFGAITAAAVGFASSVGLSGLYSVAFTLVGITAGALSSFGIIPAVLTAGVALSVWGGYSDGIVGFLSVFPEYAIAAAFAVPLFKRIKTEPTREEIVSSESIAKEMVGTMALAYKSRYSGSLDRLEGTLASISELTVGLRASDAEIKRDELMRLLTECISRYFATEGAHIPGLDEAKAAFIETREAVIPILRAGNRVTKDDFGTPAHLSIMASGIADAVNRAVAIISEERFREKARDTLPEDYSTLARLVSEARADDDRERMPNDKLRESLSELLTNEGITPHSAEVFGIRRLYMLIAFEDDDGARIGSRELHEKIEERLGVRLSSPDYYRKGKIALMECRAKEKYSASSFSSGSALVSGAPGDTSRSFRTAEGIYFALIADGMGCGEDAMLTSRFVADYMARALEFGKGAETSLRLLNSIAKRRPAECSVGVDLFSFDLMTGEGMFFKCGAAPSYIKRGSSLFRIRSRTSPIGISAEIDAERVRVELEEEDLLIMFSDGISEDGEAPWLLDVISRTDISSPKALGEAILATARKSGSTSDDLTVMITKIEHAK